PGQPVSAKQTQGPHWLASRSCKEKSLLAKPGQERAEHCGHRRGQHQDHLIERVSVSSSPNGKHGNLLRPLRATKRRLHQQSWRRAACTRPCAPPRFPPVFSALSTRLQQPPNYDVGSLLAMLLNVA